MRKLIYFGFALLLAACAHSQEASVNSLANPPDLIHASDKQVDAFWVGEYQGVLPCASCEGIQVQLRLNDDLSYQRTLTYLGKKAHSESVEGRFSWMANNLIKLDKKADFSVYLLEKNKVQMRQQDGSAVQSPLAENYVLHKK